MCVFRVKIAPLLKLHMDGFFELAIGVGSVSHFLHVTSPVILCLFRDDDAPQTEGEERGWLISGPSGTRQTSILPREPSRAGRRSLGVAAFP